MDRIFKIVFVLFNLIILTACSSTTDPSNKAVANFSGIVEEVSDQSLLIKVNKEEEEFKSSDLIRVSLINDRLAYKIDFNQGDEVIVYYDGRIMESYPAQISQVDSIILKEDRENSADSN